VLQPHTRPVFVSVGEEGARKRAIVSILRLVHSEALHLVDNAIESDIRLACDVLPAPTAEPLVPHPPLCALVLIGAPVRLDKIQSALSPVLAQHDQAARQLLPLRQLARSNERLSLSDAWALAWWIDVESLPSMSGLWTLTRSHFQLSQYAALLDAFDRLLTRQFQLSKRAIAEAIGCTVPQAQRLLYFAQLSGHASVAVNPTNDLRDLTVSHLSQQTSGRASQLAPTQAPTQSALIQPQTTNPPSHRDPFWGAMSKWIDTWR
jgi:hypothetical protein